MMLMKGEKPKENRKKTTFAQKCLNVRRNVTVETKWEWMLIQLVVCTVA